MLLKLDPNVTLTSTPRIFGGQKSSCYYRKYHKSKDEPPAEPSPTLKLMTLTSKSILRPTKFSSEDHSIE